MPAYRASRPVVSAGLIVAGLALALLATFVFSWGTISTPSGPVTLDGEGYANLVRSLPASATGDVAHFWLGGWFVVVVIAMPAVTLFLPWQRGTLRFAAAALELVAAVLVVFAAVTEIRVPSGVVGTGETFGLLAYAALLVVLAVLHVVHGVRPAALGLAGAVALAAVIHAVSLIQLGTADGSSVPWAAWVVLVALALVAAGCFVASQISRPLADRAPRRRRRSLVGR